MNVALANIARGYAVIPLAPGTKKPINKGWTKGAAFRTVEDVRQRWPGVACNVGILCEGWLVVDVDVHKGGAASFERLQELGALPRTLKHRTWSMGIHQIYRLPSGTCVSNGPLAGFPGIDIKSTGGQIVAPGSVISGLDYSVEDDTPIVEAPQWLLQLAGTRPARERDINAGKLAPGLPALDTPTAVEMARRIIASAPTAHEGIRNNTAFKVAARIMDCGISEEMTLTLIEEWVDEKGAGIEYKEVEEVVASAVKSRQNPIGSAHPEVVAQEVFDTIAEPPKRKLLEFPQEIDLDRLIADSTNYVVEDIIWKGETSAIYGVSTAGKTFTALDMAFHISLGKDWHGRKVKRGPVLYVGLEGERGLSYRIKAAEKTHGSPGNMFARLIPRVSLAIGDAGQQGLKDVIAACDELKEANGQPVSLVIIDTFSRAAPGIDENAAGEVMAFIEGRMQEIASQTGAHVHVVHHPGKSGDIRGSSVFKPSFETLLQIEYDKDTKRRTVVAEKLKDADDGVLFHYELSVVELGVNSEGKRVTSCVVNEVEPDTRETKLEGIAQWASQLIRQAIETGRPLSPVSKANDNVIAYLMKMRAPGSDVSRNDIVDAYATYLDGIEYETRDMPDDRGRFKPRIVPRG